MIPKALNRMQTAFYLWVGWDTKKLEFPCVLYNQSFNCDAC